MSEICSTEVDTRSKASLLHQHLPRTPQREASVLDRLASDSQGGCLSHFSFSPIARSTYHSTSDHHCSKLLDFVHDTSHNQSLPELAAQFNSIESIVYFNLATLAAITWYSFDNSQNGFQTFQIVISYISMGGTLILFIFVLIFHAYRYGSEKFYNWCKTTRFVRELQHLFEHGERRHYIAQSDRNVNQLFKVIDNQSSRDRPDATNPILHQGQGA